MLVLVIGAFIVSARFLRRLHHLHLPGNLGVDIVSETNGFTTSLSRQGKTLYTIHAAKSVEHANGMIGLHDASVILYGKKGDRHDHIYGDEFEYDQKSGLIRAKGLVHMDLQAASEQTGDAAAKPVTANRQPKVLHVTTSDLVYMDKLGVAATNEYIEFQAEGMTGHATGADYDSDSGLLVLHSAVTMSGVAGGRPLTLTASGARFNNRSQEAFLTGATYESQGRTAKADQATLHSRPDGTLARVEAQGNVTAEVNGATVVSQQADVVLNASSHPQSAVLTGGVHYAKDLPLRQVRGQSDAATIAFDSQADPQPQHAVFTGSVHMTERTRLTGTAKEPWSTRDLTAAKFEAQLAPAGPGKSELRDVEATGNPHLVEVNRASPAGAETTELSGDDLKAHLFALADARQAPQLETLAGRGHTVLRQLNAEGIEQTSGGDTLDAKFRKKPAGGSAKTSAVANAKAVAANQSDDIADTISSAVQQGHVTMTRSTPAKAGVTNSANESIEHAIAERAVYDGDQQRMTLNGSVRVTDAGNVLWANQVTLDRTTGNSQAVGAVKVDYVQPPASGKAGAASGGQTADEPTHIIADRADMEHASGVATFYGKPVRLWQGGDQVLAPVIEMAQVQKRLIARGELGTGWSAAVQAAQVHTVLVNSGTDKSGVAAKAGHGDAPSAKPAGANKSSTAGTPQAMRIASGGLVYSGILRQADFTGGFRAETADGTIRANQGTVYLKPQDAAGQTAVQTAGKALPAATPAEPLAAAPSLTGSVERVVATGDVEIDQPGMHATGTRLVYTASDQVSVLTGTASVPPKAVGQQGTTTGAALRFHSGDNSVEALGSVAGEPSQRVRTESKISGEGKKEKDRP